MRKKVSCVALALLMCLMIAVPTFADSKPETPDRAVIGVTFGLKHVSGSSYKMWATILNPGEQNVIANLILYDASYNYITSVSRSSSSSVFYLGKNVTLSSGTYHLRINYVGDTVSQTLEKTYSI